MWGGIEWLSFLGCVTGLILGAITVWVYDSLKIPTPLRRLVVCILMSPYIYAVTIASSISFIVALGMCFPIGIIGLAYFARLRASKIEREE